MDKLIKGIKTFQKVFGEKREFFEKLADGQNPEVLFITCSDSRVAPNLITQTDPGDVFIMRNAGNLVPSNTEKTCGEAATIEFAVSVLGLQHIVVCGHTGCGAIKALLNPKSVEHLPLLAEWLKHADATRRIVEKKYAHLDEDARLLAAVQQNVLVQLAHVRAQPSVQAAMAAGQMRLHGWVYVLETGEVLAYDEAAQTFMPLRPNMPDVSSKAINNLSMG
jgi:carbonic anhydrase